MTEFILEVVDWLPKGVPAVSVQQDDKVYWFVAKGLIHPCATRVLSDLGSQSLSRRFWPRRSVALP